jgi:hypothetical protein
MPRLFLSKLRMETLGQVAGPCARIALGHPFAYEAVMGQDKRLHVTVTDLTSARTVVVANYSYGFLSHSFLNRTRWYVLTAVASERTALQS